MQRPSSSISILERLLVRARTYVARKTSPATRRRIVGIIHRGSSLLPRASNLTLLALRHGTDKWSHGYIPHYERHFHDRRSRRLNILEIGVGGHEAPEQGGASLRMWQEYFPNSAIYGLDVVDKTMHADQRIRIFTGSQNDDRFLRQIADQVGRFDVVIDDGSHISEHVITAFSALFPHLADGGIYVIEDIETSYWPQFGGAWREPAPRPTSVAMLKRLIDGLNYAAIPGRQPDYFDRNITSLHFYPGIVFIYKGDNLDTLSSFAQQSRDEAGNLS